MANVSVRSSTKAASASASSITISEPAGAIAGDWLVVWVGGNGTADLTDNNGSTPFTRTYAAFQGNFSAATAVFVRKRVAGDPSSLSFSSDLTDRISAIAVAFQDGDTTTAYDVTPDGTTDDTDSGSQTSIDCNDITTINDNALHIICGAVDRSSESYTGFPTGYTLVEDETSGGQSIVMSYKAIATAGATGAQSFTVGTAATFMTQSFAIKNGAGGGGLGIPIAAYHHFHHNLD